MMRLSIAAFATLASVGIVSAQPATSPGGSAPNTQSDKAPSDTQSGGREPQVIDQTGHQNGADRPTTADPGRTTNDGSPGSRATPGSAGQGNVSWPDQK
jgi:hypothetical protein